MAFLKYLSPFRSRVASPDHGFGRVAPDDELGDFEGTVTPRQTGESVLRVHVDPEGLLHEELLLQVPVTYHEAIDRLIDPHLAVSGGSG